MIFIIDDDKSVLRAISLLLQFSGFDVRGFSSAEEFLKETHITDSDCIILDLSMPGMSGLIYGKTGIQRNQCKDNNHHRVR